MSTISCRKLSFGLALFLLSHSLPAIALDMDTFITTILKHNPGVQRILADEAIAAGKLESSKGIDDPVFRSSLGLAHTEPDQLTGLEAADSDNQTLSLSVDRKFSDTGTSVSLSYDYQNTDRTPPLSTLGSNYYQPSLTLQLTQPLLKNAGGIQDRLNIDLNRIGLNLSKLNSRESLESYITQLANLYLDWYLAAREVNISQGVYQQAIEQEKLVRLKVKRQVAESYELLRVQEIKEDYYSRWQQASGSYTGLTSQIRRQMNLPEDDATSPMLPGDPQHSRLLTLQQATNRPADYLGTASRLKGILDAVQAQEEYLLNARKNAKRADLDLNLGYTRHGIDDSFADAQGTNFEQDDYSIMLQYRIPLGNRQAHGAYNEQIASKRKTEADTSQRLIDAQSRLENFQAQAAALQIALASVDKKISLAEQKIKQQRQLYKIGRLDLFELLQDNTAQLESRLNRENLAIQLFKIQLTIGELLDINLDAVHHFDAS